jgi:two-component system, OmpR family, sensor kinase
MSNESHQRVGEVNQERRFETLQKLLAIPAANLSVALTHAANAIADALCADKVDAFLYDEKRDSLVAIGVSTQPLSNLQRKLGLDVLPVSNGGRVVHVFQTGETFVSGNLRNDPDELKGVKDGLRIESKIGVPLEVAGQRRGMMMIASLKRDFFSDIDASFAEIASKWVSMVAHRAQLIQDIERNALEDGRRMVAHELITMLAHDLRNLLNPLQLRLYKLRHRADQDERADDREDIVQSLRALTNVNALITNLLDAARLDDGAFNVDFAPVDLVALVREAAAVASTAEHPVVVKAAVAVIVSADAVRIRQCIDNVISNAIDHSPENAPVSIFIAHEKHDGQDWSRIDVIDEGPGIPDDLLPVVFDRFVSRRKGKGGLGLGLYMAKRIATAHGGDVTADRADGKGARFSITLPILHEQKLDRFGSAKTENVARPDVGHIPRS